MSNLPSVGTFLRPLASRDGNRIVRVIEVHADRVRVERFDKDFGRRTFLSRKTLGLWVVVTEPERMGRMELIREVERLREAVGTALAALEGYLQGESGLPFTDPYRAARTAAEALRAVSDEEGL